MCTTWAYVHTFIMQFMSLDPFWSRLQSRQPCSYWSLCACMVHCWTLFCTIGTRSAHPTCELTDPMYALTVCTLKTQYAGTYFLHSKCTIPCTSNVHRTCTLPCWLGLQCTLHEHCGLICWQCALHVHSAALIALTMYTKHVQSDGDCTNSVNCMQTMHV